MAGLTRRDALGLAGMAALGLAGCNAETAGKVGSGSTDADGSATGLSVTPLDPEVTATWDAQYYVPAYATSAEAKAAGDAVALDIEREGIVLLRNAGGVLPLEAGTAVSLLGRASVDTVYGGTGAAQFSTDDCVSLHDALAAAGLTLNETVCAWTAENYAAYPRGAVGQLDHPETVTHYLGEIPWSAYPSAVRASLAGTVGVVVVGRPAFEGHDLSTNLLADLESDEKPEFVPDDETANYAEGQHQLELCQEELDLLAAARQACDALVVLLNCGTTMEVGPLVEEGGPCEADAILQIGLPGAVGATAVGEVLVGAVNPSGRTTDTWAADLLATPSVRNVGNHTYTDVSDFYTQIGSEAHFVEYREGIYVGYRWWETAAAMGALDYDSSVVFPFGYGLGYTVFSRELTGVTVEDDEVHATVVVKNVGSVAGKDVAQLYVSAPWTRGGLEKPSAQLVAFAKTDELAPGEQTELSLSWQVRDMASYSTADAAWVLDAGSYEVSLRADAHTVVDSQTIELDGATYATDSATGNAIQNRFADLDEYLANNATLLTRADMAGTFPQNAGDRTAAACGIELAEFDVEAAQDPADEMPVTGADNGVGMIDLRARPMDDPLWELLLDELDPRVMGRVVSNNIYGTSEVPAVGKPENRDADGPAGIAYMDDTSGHTAYPSEYAVAQTWNAELARRMGEAVAEEGLTLGINGWCAPALNMHRSPFGGRNFEYYSEDPLLAGRMGTAAVEGAGLRGMYCQIKHFCLNDQDTNRCAHILTWAPEQAVREIYARPFELVVKNARRELPYLDEEGNRQAIETSAATAVMSSYNFVGATWSGGRESLQTGLLRDEWGYEGYVVSDWSFYDYMNKNQAIYAGTDINFTQDSDTGKMEDTTSATAVIAMRRSMHHLLYTLANSNLANGLAPTVHVE